MKCVLREVNSKNIILQMYLKRHGMPICINALFKNSYWALFELRNVYIFFYIKECV